jgi:glycosyltransferase involved in cell wall biosynthesis
LEESKVKLLLVGDGSYMTELIELVDDLGLKNDVIFTGRVPRNEVFNYIDLMDVCAAPNAEWYQSPIKIFEYGAMGKPIIGPDTEAVKEIMVSGEDGILTNGSVGNLKEGLTYLLENREKALVMGKNFQKKVLNEYTWKNNVRKVLAAKERIQYP